MHTSSAASPTQQPVARPLDGLLKAPRLVLMGAIRVYQSTIGPALPNACRFEPTCSCYAYTALERYGVFRGLWLAVRRLARCQPFGGSGYDPVP
jgi:putative membrane protein insertion efficiency factor